MKSYIQAGEAFSLKGNIFQVQIVASQVAKAQITIKFLVKNTFQTPFSNAQSLAYFIIDCIFCNFDQNL